MLVTFQFYSFTINRIIFLLEQNKTTWGDLTWKTTNKI